jgi:acyl-coenzyme A synthetase/AMP-(fatty) acid ligase
MENRGIPLSIIPTKKTVLNNPITFFLMIRNSISLQNHLNRIKSLSIKQQDVVLVAIPMSEKNWLEVIDACIYTGADFVMIDPISEATSLAEIIKREKVTVVATTMQIWTHIYRQLNAKSVENKSLRIIRYNDRGEPESRRQVLRAMSK